MTAAQGRLAGTIDTFYGAADRNSEGAMAGHAYKRAVDDMEASTSKEFVSPHTRFFIPVIDFEGRTHRTAPPYWNP